jgi:hypothetical protein
MDKTPAQEHKSDGFDATLLRFDGSKRMSV